MNVIADQELKVKEALDKITDYRLHAMIEEREMFLDVLSQNFLPDGVPERDAIYEDCESNNEIRERYPIF